MNLIGEQFIPNKVDNSKKWKTLLIVLIIIVILSIIGVIAGIYLLKEKPLVVKLNGESNTDLKNILRFEEDGQIHIPIREMAEILGYTSYNGNYINRSEDINECYVETNEEIVEFVCKANKIEKINTNNQENTYFYIDEPIQLIDGKLYTTQEGIEKAFNLKFKYDQQSRTVTLETMQYIMDLYKSAILEAGYDDVSTDFNDEKAILNDLVIVRNNGQSGLFNIKTDEKILETKYAEIKYIPTTGDFLISNNGKIGIITDTGKDRIKMQYDSIELVSQDSKLYVVKKDDKYGVINQNEKAIIPINYDTIGIDAQSYTKNNIKNKYLLMDKIIPVKKDDLWGIYDIEGNVLFDCKFSEFGCKSSKTRNTENVLIIPDYNVLVARKDNRYYLLNQYGEILYNKTYFDEVYMTVELDEVNYYIVRNEKKYDLIKELEKLKKKTSNNNSENTET